MADRYFAPGFLPEPDIAELMNAADVFVFPSLAEGFGMPNVEAMACGCPVRADLIRRGGIRARLFSWERSAERLLALTNGSFPFRVERMQPPASAGTTRASWRADPPATSARGGLPRR